VSATFVEDANANHLQEILAIQNEAAEAPKWSEEIWKAILDAPESLRAARFAWVAVRDGKVCGFLVMRRTMEHAELESMAVDLAVRRQGVGQLLLLCAARWAMARGLTVELEVRESNAAALGLYRRMGFTEHGRRAKYYRNPEEDAILMAAKL